jgi:hypothetical protein
LPKDDENDAIQQSIQIPYFNSDDGTNLFSTKDEIKDISHDNDQNFNKNNISKE